MDRIEDVLVSEHRKIEKKLKEIVEAKSDAEKLKIFNAAATEILEHMQGEERIYYPSISKIEEKEDELAESKQEHHVAKILIREIQNVQVNSPEWSAKVEVLKENLEHHHEEEEEELFPLTKDKFDNAKGQRLAKEFSRAKKIGQESRPQSSFA